MRNQIRADVAMALTILVLASCLAFSGLVVLQRLLRQDHIRRAFSFADALGVLAAGLGSAVVLWWLASMLLALLSGLLALAGRRRSAELTGRLAPGFMRRLVLAVLGLNLLAAPLAQAAEGPIDPLWHPSAAVATAPATAPASAGFTSNQPPAPAHAESVPPLVVRSPGGSPLWRPQPPVVSPGPLAPPSIRAIWPLPTAPVASSPYASGAPDDPSDDSVHLPGSTPRGVLGPGSEVVVRAGDTLWTLAAAQLGPLATDLEIAQLWPRWFQANRAVIGNNPNVLLPGQILRAP